MNRSVIPIVHENFAPYLNVETFSHTVGSWGSIDYGWELQ